MFPAILLGALLWSPMVVMAWLKIGPVAGIAATVVFGLGFLIAIQPGAQTFGNLPGVWYSRRRSQARLHGPSGPRRQDLPEGPAAEAQLLDDF